MKYLLISTKGGSEAFTLPTDKVSVRQEICENTNSDFSPLSGKVLILNQSYEPVSICTAKKALILIFMLKAEIVAPCDNRFVRSVSMKYPYPSVIRLANYIRVPYKKIELSRRNIMRRDGYRCQYCGEKTHELTIDHVIPKSRGGSDTWENLVSACKHCNNKKGDKTPEEANMPLLRKPRRPHHILFIKQYLGNVDEKWKPFLFM